MFDKNIGALRITEINSVIAEIARLISCFNPALIKAVAFNAPA